jgi:taurine--2-oxoglutarate transaminase
MLIADEVMTGFGRTGRWFAFEHADVVPDLLTFAKGVNSGYVPLGGVVMSDAIYATFTDRVYPGGLTYSGHPLACAAAVATLEVLQEERIVQHSAALGENVLGPGLRALADKHDWIGEVRGVGTFWAIELVSDRETREPLAPYGGTSPAMASILAACTSRGLLPFANFNRIHAVPPLTTSADEAREGLDILDQALSEARSRHE